MPGDSGEPRGDYARVVLFFPTRGCGCIAHPAFPTPSIILGKRFMHHSGVEPSRERAGAGGPSDVVVGCQTSSLRGANATRQSTLAQPRKMDCFVVSLLAMTRAFAVMAGKREARFARRPGHPRSSLLLAKGRGCPAQGRA